MYANLKQFVRALESSGQLARVTSRVDPVLEITAITDQVSKSAAPGEPSASSLRNDPRFCRTGGRALLFENVADSDIPVLINAFGSYRRMEMALGCHDQGHTPGGFDALAAKIADLVKPEPPSGLRDALGKARKFLPLLRIPPKRHRGSGECQQIVLKGDQVDLTRLPILRCWPLDGDLASVGYPADVNDGIAGLGQGAEWDAKYRGRYITLAGIHTVHADDRDNPRPPSHNIGMYRVQLLGPRTLAMHWHMHHDGARHWRSWKALGKPMPVAIVLGGQSVLPYAGTAPLPPGISELLMAGFLNRGGISMVRAKTVPLWIPADAEIVIEGFVSCEAGMPGWDPRVGRHSVPTLRSPHSADGASSEADQTVGTECRPTLGPGAVFEGPFGDHTGFYSLPDRYPLLSVTAMTMRPGAIYPTTVVGLPPQEDYYLGKATERLFLPLLRTLVHDIDDYDLPMFGAFHNCAAVQIKKAYPLQGRRVMHSIWGAGQMAWTKSIFVVGHDVNVHDTAAVLSEAGRRCHPLRDVETVNGPLDILDHAAPRLGAGMKIGFDCTRKIAGEEVAGVPVGADEPAGEPLAQSTLAALSRLPGVVKVNAPTEAFGWLFVKINKAAAGDGAKTALAIAEALPDEVQPRFVVVLGQDVDVTNIDEAMFHLCAHADASRDMDRLTSTNGHSRLIFDATPKVPGDQRRGQPVRPWPPILKMDEAVVERVRAVVAPVAKPV